MGIVFRANVSVKWVDSGEKTATSLAGRAWKADLPQMRPQDGPRIRQQ